jgi:tetratricopeptide (TPR) repeat protein
MLEPWTGRYDIRRFISHSTKDKQAADATCAALEGAGIRCWIAPRDVRPGTEYAAAIIEAIDTCRIMVVIVSSHSNESRQVPREVERAVSKGVTIIPMRIEDVVPQQAMGYFLDSIHWLDAITPPLTKHLEQLVGDVTALLRIDADKSATLPASEPTTTATMAATAKRKAVPSRTALLSATAAVLAVAILGGGAYALFGGRSEPAESTGVGGGYIGNFTTSVAPGIARLAFLDITQHDDVLQIYWETDGGGKGTASGTIGGNGVANMKVDETTPTCPGNYSGVMQFFASSAVHMHFKGKSGCLGPQEVDGSATRSALATQIAQALKQQMQGYLLFKTSSYAEALTQFRATNAIFKDAAAKDKSSLWRYDLASSYYDIANTLARLKRPRDALVAYQEGIDISKALVAADPATAQWRYTLLRGAQGLGSTAYDFLKAKSLQSALDTANQAVAIAPGLVWLYAAKAAALMFLGNVDDARAIYLKYENERNVYDGQDWRTYVLQDFEDFRAAGLNNALMDEIRKRFAAGG